MAVDSSNPIVHEPWHDEAVQMNKVPVIGSSKGPSSAFSLSRDHCPIDNRDSCLSFRRDEYIFRKKAFHHREIEILASQKASKIYHFAILRIIFVTNKSIRNDQRRVLKFIR